MVLETRRHLSISREDAQIPDDLTITVPSVLSGKSPGGGGVSPLCSPTPHAPRFFTPDALSFMEQAPRMFTFNSRVRDRFKLTRFLPQCFEFHFRFSVRSSRGLAGVGMPFVHLW